MLDGGATELVVLVLLVLVIVIVQELEATCCTLETVVGAAVVGAAEVAFVEVARVLGADVGAAAADPPRPAVFVVSLLLGCVHACVWHCSIHLLHTAGPGVT